MQPHWLRLTNLGLFILIYAAVMGCSTGDDSPRVQMAPAEQQVLRVPLASDIKTLDPNLAAFTNEVSVIHQLFRGLLRYDEKLNLTAAVAREVPSVKNRGISADGLVYTFRLREDQTWSDGSPLTATDFEYSIKRVLDPALRTPYASLYFDIKGAEDYASSSGDASTATLDRLRAEVGVRAEGSQTLVITLRTPRAAFLHLMSLYSVNPVPRHVVEQHGAAWISPENFAGNGPFLLSEAVLNDHVVLTPNPYWSGVEPKLASVVFRVIPNRTDAFNQYIAGQLDYAGVVRDLLDVVSADPELHRENVQLPVLGSAALFFNNTKPPFDDVLVRQAFSLAIDREVVMNEFQRGAAVAGYSWLPPGIPGYNKAIGTEWKLDIEKAKKLLSEAGYPEGNGLATIVFFHTPAQATLAQTLQRQISANLGIQITLEPVESAVSRDRLLKGDYQIVSYGEVADYVEASAFLTDIFGCQRYDGDQCSQYASSNRGRYANPEFDRLMQQAAKELDEGRRIKLYERAQKLVAAEAPAIFLGHMVRNAVVKPHVSGLVASGMDREVQGDYGFERVYIVAP